MNLRALLRRRTGVAAACHFEARGTARAADAHAVGTVLARVPGDVRVWIGGPDQRVGHAIDRHGGRDRVPRHAGRRRTLVPEHVGNAHPHVVRALHERTRTDDRRVLPWRNVIFAARHRAARRAAGAPDAHAVGTVRICVPCHVRAGVRRTDRVVRDRVDRDRGGGEILHHIGGFGALVACRVDYTDPDRIERLEQAACAHRRDLRSGRAAIGSPLHLRSRQAARIREPDAVDLHAVCAALIRVPGHVGARVRKPDQAVRERFDHHRRRDRVLLNARRRGSLVGGNIGDADPDRVGALGEVTRTHGRRVLDWRIVVGAPCHLEVGRAAGFADTHAVGPALICMPGDVGTRVGGADQGIRHRVDLDHRGGRVCRHRSRRGQQRQGKRSCEATEYGSPKRPGQMLRGPHPLRRGRGRGLPCDGQCQT